MDLNEFVYELPKSLLAAFPTASREASRLMVVRRESRQISHSAFSELGSFLQPGDLLVLNDTRVFPARLRGTKQSGGKAEILLLERFPDPRSLWIAILKATKKPRVGSRIYFSDHLVADVIGDMGQGRFGLEFYHDGDFYEQLESCAEPPLPPYIRAHRHAAPLDWERYQTVYAAKAGAIAAPTAGFHFTAELLEKLRTQGIDHVVLTLHVGPGTFQPLRAAQVENHRMEGERYVLTAKAAEKINETKLNGRRIIAVGSTSTRALEWIARKKGRVEADEGIARLFIRPGERFRLIDGLITNFHLPASTPLVLVSAFAGLELIREAYREAIRERYRFYSYGDAMLIL